MGNGQVRTRGGDTVFCLGCQKYLPKSKFGPASPYRDGTPRVKSRCRECSRIDAKRRADRLTEDQILSVEAPFRAAEELIRTNPEIFADLIRRYHHYYIPLLAKHRERLTKQRAEYLKKVRTKSKKKAA